MYLCTLEIPFGVGALQQRCFGFLSDGELAEKDLMVATVQESGSGRRVWATRVK